MKWYYAEGGKQIGPVEESALDDLVRQGVVRDDTLVWREGMAAWHGWVEKHKDVIVELGGPLGKTRRIDRSGITEISNALTGFTVVRAASQEEAAKLFENHPHFAIFPGEAIEVMPVLPIPQM